MDKIGIISDIHGNYPALKCVMDQLQKKKCKTIICLGDITGYYSMINECIALLRKKNVICIRGNHDSYLLGESHCERSNTVNRCILYQRGIIKKEYLEWLGTLQTYIVLGNLFAIHGGFCDHLEQYVDEFDFSYAKKHYPLCNFFTSGHSHKAKIQCKDDMIYCNPGSVGQPRDYDWKASYAVLENSHFSLYRVEYPVDEIALHMKNNGFDEYFYGNLYHGCKIGE